MAYFPLKKFLDKYFYAEDIAEILKNMGETPTGKKDNDIELLIKEWPRHGNNYYDFLEMLKTPELREICKKYSIDSKGDEQKMIKRIKKEKLFEDSNKKLKISGGIGLVAIFLFVLAIYGAGSDTFSLITYFTSEETGLDFNCVSGEFGLKIVNCKLGLEITRPDVNWLSDTEYGNFYIPDEIIHENEFVSLGSLIVGKKGSASLSIRVFEIKNMDKLDFEIMARSFQSHLKNTYPTLEHTEFFIVGQNAIFEMIDKDNDGQPYISKYQIEIHDNKMYVFVDNIRTDRSDIRETYDELKKLYASFTYL